MPLYEYQCEACGHRFELIQKFSDAPADTCPSCGSGPVRKLLSSPAIQFKGTGWYITDYAKKDQTAAGKSSSDSSKEKSDKSSEKASSESKSDTKSETKSDSGSSTSTSTGTTSTK